MELNFEEIYIFSTENLFLYTQRTSCLRNCIYPSLRNRNTQWAIQKAPSSFMEIYF